jgi:hypothetical protein
MLRRRDLMSFRSVWGSNIVMGLSHLWLGLNAVWRTCFWIKPGRILLS